LTVNDAATLAKVVFFRYQLDNPIRTQAFLDMTLSDWDTKSADEGYPKCKTVTVLSATHKTVAEHGPNVFGLTGINEQLVSKKYVSIF
jgi:hypothetical protein